MANKAILYGINNYKSPHISDLRGCVNDVRNLEDLLLGKFEFESRNVRARKDQEVTLDKIRKDWKWLVKGAKAGDQLVFHFAGHGSQVANDGDDYEKDGLDEILCLYDMDFDDPDSYLIDDQIHEWTSKLPNGVKMTFLLDCCHSGTGTRGMNISMRSLGTTARAIPRVIQTATDARRQLPEFRGSKKKQQRSLDSSESLEDQDLVFARYLVPPQEVLERVEQRSMKRSKSSTKRKRSSSLERTNHVRFSGCKDEQTSADAWIDGKFQGAFSSHFRKAIEEEGIDVSHSDLIEEIRRSIEYAGFEQIPQLSPNRLSTSVFNGIDDNSRSDEQYEVASGAERQIGRLLERVEGLIELMERACGDSVSIDVGKKRKRRDTEDTAERSIVYVHGICWHDSGYSIDWFRAMRPHLTRDLAARLERNHEEVLWSKHVSTEPDSRSHGRTETKRGDEEQQLFDELHEILRDRATQAAELQMSPTHSRGARTQFSSRDIERALLGIPGLDCVDDFVKYLYSRATRKKVIKEFTKVVVPLLESGHEIDIISHSWGTVVAFESLHQLSSDQFDGRVKNLFTVGSALSIRSVQRRLKYGAETGERPGLVDNWVNIDARGDIVGGTLRGFSTEVDSEYLNLEPVGCSEGIFGVSPSCSHSSYFNERNITVNRDIFARYIS